VNDADSPVLVLGASGAVGSFLLTRLARAGFPAIAVSRRAPTTTAPGTTWLQHDLERRAAPAESRVLISAGPLRLAAAQVEAMRGVRRVVALSSASVRFKQRSPDAAERRTIAALIESEARLREACARRGAALTLLRPTLIYGGDAPSALSRVADWVAARRWVPVAGRGLRQPVHADDLAELMLAAAAREPAEPQTYEVGGGETLRYPEFIRRIASSVGRDVRIVRVPAVALLPLLRLARATGRLASVTPAMVARQRMDLVVDDAAARGDLGWNPRPFRP
jgi:nucleoside-diphosphate-sugar epimerase